MGDVHGEDVSQDDGDDRDPPDESNGNYVDIYAILGSAEQVPPETKRIGKERNDPLAWYGQVRDEVRHVVGQCDGDQRQDEDLGNVKDGRVGCPLEQAEHPREAEKDREEDDRDDE